MIVFLIRVISLLDRPYDYDLAVPRGVGSGGGLGWEFRILLPGLLRSDHPLEEFLQQRP